MTLKSTGFIPYPSIISIVELLSPVNITVSWSINILLENVEKMGLNAYIVCVSFASTVIG